MSKHICIFVCKFRFFKWKIILSINLCNLELCINSVLLHNFCRPLFINSKKMWATSDRNVCWLFETNHWWQFGTFQISIKSAFPVVFLTFYVTEYICHENVPLAVRIILSFPHSWFITVFVTRLSRRVPFM